MAMYTSDVPLEEKPVYEELLKLRACLLELKNNRLEFMKSSDVKNVYDAVLTQHRRLREIRKSKSGILNKVDLLLDESFQLLLLSFMTVGLTKTAPATYASLLTVQRLLEHLVESKVYTKHDLAPIKERLDEIGKIILALDYHKFGSDSANSNAIEEQELLHRKWTRCIEEFSVVEKNVDQVSPALSGYLEDLIGLRRQLMALVTRKGEGSSFSNEVQRLANHLAALEKHRDENGDFLTKEDKEIEDKKGQTVLNGLLDECHNVLNDLKYITMDVLARQSLVDAALEPIFDKLVRIKTALENLLVTHRWTLRETDLFNYQKELQKIDNMRVDGKFRDQNGTAYTKGQTLLLYLLRRCYAIIYKLLELSEPVSEALQPIHNQLSTVRRCLLDVKRMGGISSTRELYPFQMKLALIDDMRVDGKFEVGDQIPEGQGTLNALLAECYDICYEMRVEMEERHENNGGEEEDEPEDEGDRQYEALEEEDYEADGKGEYEYDSYLPSENVTGDE